MSQKIKVADIREEYTLGELLEKDLAATPTAQFTQWLNDALAHKVYEPNAMTLSTVSEEGRPSSRIVLLKEFDESGFVFFTNYESRKGQDMKANAHVCLLFFWPELQRQVRVEGVVQKLDTQASDIYFHSRPIGSQLGALASPQSRAVPDREFLDQRLEELTRQYMDPKSIDRPEHWGGYKVTPVRVEFWQGRANRMHDRLVFEINEQRWRVTRLAP